MPAPPAPASAPVAVAKTVWGYKHGICTALLGALLLAQQLWPAAAPQLQSLEQAVEALAQKPPPVLPPAPDLNPIHERLLNLEQKPGPALALPTTGYEADVRIAWGKEVDAKKAASLREMIFLYRLAGVQAMTLGKDLDDLYLAFRDKEKSLDLVAKLPNLKAIVREEWKRQIPEVAPLPLTDPLRVRLGDFANQTARILEKLP